MREYFCNFSDCSIWTRPFTDETKIVLAKVNPTKTGRISVGSGTERFGHHSRPAINPLLSCGLWTVEKQTFCRHLYKSLFHRADLHTLQWVSHGRNVTDPHWSEDPEWNLKKPQWKSGMGKNLIQPTCKYIGRNSFWKWQLYWTTFSLWTCMATLFEDVLAFSWLHLFTMTCLGGKWRLCTSVYLLAVTALPVRHFLYRRQHFIFHLLVHQKSLGADLLLRYVSRHSEDQSEKAGGHYERSPPG